MSFKALFFTIGSEIVASSRLRVYQYLPFLKGRDIAYKVINYMRDAECRLNISLKKASLKDKFLNRIYNLMQLARLVITSSYYDIVFIQRALLPRPIQNILVRKNKNIIYDFDDALYLADTRYGTERSRKFENRLINILKISRVVIIENELNHAYASKYCKQVFSLPDPIDLNRYGPLEKKEDEGVVTLGWLGGPGTSGNLDGLKGVFKELSKKYNNLKILLIGAKPMVQNGFRAEIKPWTFDSEIEDLQRFDIAIRPLIDDEWSKGKGPYKLLQYMAVGVPSVVSPVGVNNEIIKEGANGFFARTREEWIEKLSILIEDAALRKKMGLEARRMVEGMRSYEDDIKKFISILEKAGGR